MTCAYDNSGRPCGSQAMVGSDKCWFHNPDVTEVERKSARSSGGRNRAKKIDSPRSLLAEPTPIAALRMLATVINEVRSGSLDIRIANCLGFLSGHLLRAFEVAEFDTRITALEEAIREQEKQGRQNMRKQ